MGGTDTLTEELENRWYELGRLAIAESKRRYPPAYDKPEGYIKAAERGDADAQHRLGNIYLRGKTVERSYTEAGRWHRKAAMQGHAAAQYRCGEAYRRGVGAREDHAEAIKWFRAAAAQGYADAQYNLGRMYEPYDAAEAIAWYKKAAEDDDYSFVHEAQYRLGRLYELGENFTEAAKWYLKSADYFNDEALYHLGLLYELGKGVPCDAAEAISWYQQAANNYHPDAQYIIGCRHRDGDGVTLDYVQAYRWFALAALGFQIRMEAEKQDAAVSNRKQVAVQMTPQQIADAKLIIRKWMEQKLLLVDQKPPLTLSSVVGA